MSCHKITNKTLHTEIILTIMSELVKRVTETEFHRQCFGTIFDPMKTGIFEMHTDNDKNKLVSGNLNYVEVIGEFLTSDVSSFIVPIIQNFIETVDSILLDDLTVSQIICANKIKEILGELNNDLPEILAEANTSARCERGYC